MRASALTSKYAPCTHHNAGTAHHTFLVRLIGATHRVFIELFSLLQRDPSSPEGNNQSASRPWRLPRLARPEGCIHSKAPATRQTGELVLASMGRIGRPELITTPSTTRNPPEDGKYRWAKGPIVSMALRSGAVAVRISELLHRLGYQIE